MIAGIQKLSLLDYPGKIACTIFTSGCNFRCPFCQNADLVLPERGKPPRVEEAEVFSFLEKRRGILEGVCVTGGEPLIHERLEGFLRAIKALGFFVKLDTNGSFPERLKALVEAGLVDYVAMDLKNAPWAYDKTAGASLSSEDVSKSVAYLLSDPVDYEFRTTVVKEFHGTEEMVAMGEWIRGGRRYYLQNFRDSREVLQPGLHSPGEEQLEEWAQMLCGDVPTFVRK